MKTIGLIGGLSWESSLEYYRIVNRTAAVRLGGLHSARCLLYSFDFAVMEQLQHVEDWQAATALMVTAATVLERAGAQLLVICSNTMHRMADDVQRAVEIPLLHIADPAAGAIRAHGFQTVGLLGTTYTMEGDFYQGRLTRRHGLTVLVPDVAERQVVHAVIYDELVRGVVRDESRAQIVAVIAGLARRGAECVILGCTELMLLIGAQDSPVPAFDTTTLHAEAAVDSALA